MTPRKKFQLPGPERDPFYPAGERRGAYTRAQWPEFTGDEKDRARQDEEARVLGDLRAPVPIPHDLIDCPCGDPLHDGENHDGYIDL